MKSPLAQAPTAPVAPQGGRLVSTAGVALPLREVRLEVRAEGGVARATLRQTFENPHREPLSVSYQVPLPAGAAVSGYSFELAGVRTVGRVEAREDARRAFEDAVLAGRTGALLEEDRSTLFEQELGNLPPGAEVTIELIVDQRLTWRASGEWEWRFPTVVAPRYLGAPGSVPDAERIEVALAQDGVATRAALRLLVLDDRTGGATSPSHGLSTQAEGRALRVELDAAAGAALDRDIVVRWPVAADAPGVSLRVERPAPEHRRASSAFGLLTIVPPRAEGARPSAAHAGVAQTVARDLIVLLDTSGSMSGEPLAQAVAVVGALVDSLGERDRLELIEFSDAPRAWRAQGAVHATAAHRSDARRWLAGLSARGSTEMRAGILAALQPLAADAQRQVLLVSDGLIGAERALCDELRDRLPASCRLHVLGVGHAVNRTLTAAAARAGRGLERIVAPGEDPAAARDELLSATAAPLLVDLCIEGDALDGPLDVVRDLMGGAPTLIPLQLRATGGNLRVTGRTADGAWARDIDVAPTPAPVGDGACAALYARERVTTLDLLGARDRDRAGIDAEVERLGLEFQIVTPRTSWVATSAHASVDPTAPTRRARMPHELAAGLSVEGLGLRCASPTSALCTSAFEPRSVGAGVFSKLAHVMDPKRVPRASAPGQPAAPSNVVSESAPEFAADARRDAPSRLRRALRRLLGSGAARSGRPLTGRIVARRAGELIVEVTYDPAGEWRLPSEVVLELADGALLPATVDARRSTGSGPAAAGAVCRMTLQSRALTPSSAVARLEILDEQAVTIDLHS